MTHLTSRLKYQKGAGLINMLVSFLIILAFLLVAGTVFYNYWFTPNYNSEVIENIRYEHPEITPEDIQVVEEYKERDTPGQSLMGLYSWAGEVNNTLFEMSVLFEKDNKLTTELVIEQTYILNGEAQYNFEGSVLMFSNIKGDKALFQKIGQAVSMPDLSTLIFHGPNVDYTLKKVQTEQQR